MTTTTPKRRVTPSVSGPKGTTIYLTSRDLRQEVAVSKINGQMSDALARMLQLLINRFASKPCYSGYPFIDDIKAYAMMMLVRTWDKYDEAKSDNAFAFFTQCVKNSFNQYLNQEKKQRKIRDRERINLGLNPSYAYEAATRDIDFGDDEQDFNLYSPAPKDDYEPKFESAATDLQEDAEVEEDELSPSDESSNVDEE